MLAGKWYEASDTVKDGVVNKAFVLEKSELVFFTEVAPSFVENHLKGPETHQRI